MILCVCLPWFYAAAPDQKMGKVETYFVPMQVLLISTPLQKLSQKTYVIAQQLL